MHLERAGLTCPEASAALNARAVRETCEEVVRVHLGDPGRARMCAGLTPSAACDVAGERIAACAAERCPALDERQGAMAAIYAYDCAHVAQVGSFTREAPISEARIAESVDADTPCDDPEIAHPLMLLFEDAAVLSDGRFVDFCADAPPQPAEACAERCARLDACTFPGAQYNQPETCELLCEAHGHAAQLWACVDDAETCVDVVDCLAAGYGQDPQPEDVPICVTIAETLSGCYFGSCPAMVETGDTAYAWFHALCHTQLTAPSITVEGLEAVFGEARACDDPEVASIMDLLIYDALVSYDGLIAATCETGPATPVETCAAACARVGECEGFSGVDHCTFSCATNPRLGPQWTCVIDAAEAATCDEMLSCFQ